MAAALAPPSAAALLPRDIDTLAPQADPLTSLLQCYPAGVLLLRDSLAASGHFLLPWITGAAVKQGHKVRLYV